MTAGSNESSNEGRVCCSGDERSGSLLVVVFVDEKSWPSNNGENDPETARRDWRWSRVTKLTGSDE